MKRTDVVVIGGGQAGLAVSRCLVDYGIDHVVLERGRVAERWRSERWESLRLLTPNWQTRLPGFRYQGPDPDGFMTMGELIDFFERYVRSFPAPLERETAVRSLSLADGGYRVGTSRGVWRTTNVVIATGHSDRPFVPSMASRLPAGIVQVTPSSYRRPDDLPAGGVLVVGASATGVQLADEIHGSGRPVTLAVGRHTRLPRTYRGRDICWWMDRMGIFDESIDHVHDAGASRRQPSLQLVGRPDRRTVGLRDLHASGVRLTGRLGDIDGARVRVDDDLVGTTAAADVKLASLLRRINEFLRAGGVQDSVEPPAPFEPSWPLGADVPAATLDLVGLGIRSVVWATGFKRAYPWLQIPVLNAAGDLAHAGGITRAPGLFALGLHFQRRRKSAFIDGVGDDARELAARIARRLGHPTEAAA